MSKNKLITMIILTFVVGVVVGGLVTTYTDLGQTGKANLQWVLYRPKSGPGERCTATPQCQSGLICTNGTCQYPAGGDPNEGEENFEEPGGGEGGQ